MSHTAPAKHPQVVDHELSGGEVVLLHLESGAYHELNPVGAAIWQLLDGNRDPDRIAQELRARVEHPPEELEAVVSDFLTDLRERNLVT